MLAALALVLSVLPGRVRAQDGWYVGMQLGAAAAPGMDVRTGGLDDWSSSDVSSVRCDVTVNPDRVQVEPGACGDVPVPWGPLAESFDGGAPRSGDKLRSRRGSGVRHGPGCC